MELEKDVVREIKGKKVVVKVAFMNAIAGATIPGKYEGIVDSGASYGHEHFLVLDNGTMINIKYIQAIEII